VHFGSTLIGESAAELLPEAAVLIVVGLSFYLFALWGLRGDTLGEEARLVRKSRLGALWLISSAFFVSELGDKTQLATLAIAGDQQSFAGVWLGSTLGMVAADALAIAAGVVAGKRLPQRTVALAAAALFLVFGTLALVRGVLLLD
jgi:putative Ca2+/H+ antiporter (TMEM165/GDT1 family)